VASVAAPVAAAAVEVGVDGEPLRGAAVLVHLDVGRQGGGVVEDHGEVQDPVRQAKAAGQAAAAGGDDLPKTLHVEQDGPDRKIERDVTDTDVDDGVGGVPPIDFGTADGGPRDADLEAFQDGSSNLGGAQSDAHQLGEGVGETAEQIGDGDAQIVDEEVVAVVGGVGAAGGAHVEEHVPLGVPRDMMESRGADPS